MTRQPVPATLHPTLTRRAAEFHATQLRTMCSRSAASTASASSPRRATAARTCTEASPASLARTRRGVPGFNATASRTPASEFEASLVSTRRPVLRFCATRICACGDANEANAISSKALMGVRGFDATRSNSSWRHVSLPASCASTRRGAAGSDATAMSLSTSQRCEPQPRPEPRRHLTDPMRLTPETPIGQTGLPQDRLQARARQPILDQTPVQTRRQRPPQPPTRGHTVPTGTRVRHRAQPPIRHPHQTRRPATDLPQQAAQPPQTRTIHNTGIQDLHQRQQPAASPNRLTQRLQHAHLRVVAQHPTTLPLNQHPPSAVDGHHPTPRLTRTPAVTGTAVHHGVVAHKIRFHDLYT